MQQTCTQCSAAFEITDSDLAFYDKVSPVFAGKKEPIPPPTLCPECRQQRRLAYRNERTLHYRTCDRCHNKIVSVYAPDSGLIVYCGECWWGDAWNPHISQREVDFSRPFFDQIADVLRSVPLLSNTVLNSENSEYNSFCVDSKDAYLSQRVGNSERVSYCYLPLYCVSCTDCYGIDHCQYCYECINCWNCYQTHHSQICRECQDCIFCYDCIGCSDCIGCTSLRNKSYCIFNEQCTKEEYDARKKALRLHSVSGIRNVRTQSEALRLRMPKRSIFQVKSESVSGDYITDSRDIMHSYDVDQSETVRHSWGIEYARDVCDCDFIYHGERCLENISNSKSMSILFSFAALQNAHDLVHCIQCVNGTHDCFGCISLNHKQYCILNKQYTKEEYEALVPKIIEKMRADGEWGEFFPVTMSPFAYNETVAQEYFPMSKEEVLARGWKWRDQTDDIPKVEKIIPAAQLPDSIDDIPDDILNWAIECDATKRPFKIIKQELAFYRQMRLPVPRLHPDERHRRRMALRNPRKLWKRECMKCGKEIETSYSPERPEIVYCESCYLASVY